LAFRADTGSQKEEVVKNGEKGKLTVDRTAYSLGTSIFFSGIESKQTLVFSPGLAFGQKRDALDVDSQTGLSAKITGLFKMRNGLAVEAGVRGDNLDNGNFKGDAYGGFGYLF
jgi:hypothetical protein